MIYRPLCVGQFRVVFEHLSDLLTASLVDVKHILQDILGQITCFVKWVNLRQVFVYGYPLIFQSRQTICSRSNIRRNVQYLIRNSSPDLGLNFPQFPSGLHHRRRDVLRGIIRCPLGQPDNGLRIPIKIGKYRVSGTPEPVVIQSASIIGQEGAAFRAWYSLNKLTVELGIGRS